MVLSVKDRILILNILPQKSDIVTLRVVRELGETISFTETDIEKYKIKTHNDIHTWDITVDQDAEFKIGQAALGIIVSELKKLSDNKELTMDMIDLYKKFVESPE